MAAIPTPQPVKYKDPYTVDTYLRYGLAGALSCAVTHTAVVPLDVVKTRLQTDPGKYKGMFDGFRRIPLEEGPAMLLKGAGPTAVGYFMQGAHKFGWNEFFKHQFAASMDPETAKKYRIPMWIASSACAEVIADLFLCPLEATRIRLVAQPTFAKGLTDGFTKILRTEGFGAFYKGLPPLLLKQVPYTIAKFTVFEMVAETTYKMLPVKKEDMPSYARLAVSLGSGVVAGVAAAVVSQPADTILSKINQVKSSDGLLRSIGRIYGEIGLSGLFLGMGARAVMVGTLTAGQFFIFDWCKMLMSVTPEDLARKSRGE